jgi:Protein of unknown function (DUF4242)
MGHLPDAPTASGAHRRGMNKYLIQRTVPGVGSLSSEELRALSEKSNGVLADMGQRAQWVQSYVTDDRLFCVYVAEDEDAVREHGRCGGFPVDAVYRIGTTIDPTTAGR